MTRRASAEELLREMRGGVLPLDPPDIAEDRRDRVVSRLRQVQAEARDNRGARWKWRYVAVAVAAAVPALAAGFALHARHAQNSESLGASAQAMMVRALEGHVEVFHGPNSAEAALDVGTLLGSGDAIHTESRSRALVTMRNRAAIEVSPSTNLRIGTPEQSRSEWIDLALGRVDVAVPKLEQGRSLSVRTPHASVTVHGTRFSVVVGRRDDQTLETQVAVSEGAVLVEHDGQTTELGAGGVWSSRMLAATPAEPVARDNAGTETPGAQDAPARAESVPRVPAVAKQPLAASIGPGKPARSAVEFAPLQTSTLSDENALMERAMVAGRRGDDRNAIAILDTLLARYPHSVLRENAEVERSRALRRLEPGEGR